MFFSPAVMNASDAQSGGDLHKSKKLKTDDRSGIDIRNSGRYSGTGNVPLVLL